MATDKLIRRSGLTFSIAVQATGLEASGGFTGTPMPGETFTGGTSGATAPFAAYDGALLMVGTVTGTFTAAGELLTGAESGATITLDVNTPATEYSAYLAIGRLKSAWRERNSRGVETITDFDTAENDYFDQITNGQTGTIEGEGWVDPTNTGVQAVMGAFATNSTAKLKVVRTTIDATSVADVIKVGFMSDANVTYNESSVAEHDFSFAVTAKATS